MDLEEYKKNRARFLIFDFDIMNQSMVDDSGTMNDLAIDGKIVEREITASEYSELISEVRKDFKKYFPRATVVRKGVGLKG